MVKSMTSSDMSIRSAPPVEVAQAKSTMQTSATESQVKIDVVKTATQDLGRELASRKGESIGQLSETAAKLDKSIEVLNAAVKKVPTALHFSKDESSRRFIVQVTDTNSGEVIRTLPGDAVLRMSKQLDSLKGVLFDDTF